MFGFFSKASFCHDSTFLPVAENNVAVLKRATFFKFHSPHETGGKVVALKRVTFIHNSISVLWRKQIVPLKMAAFYHSHCPLSGNIFLSAFRVSVTTFIAPYVIDPVSHPALFGSEDGGSMFFRNVGTHLQDNVVSRSLRPQSEPYKF
jgi:hypothetical protein